MKKFFALSFCLLLALVIAGCCSSCPVKKGCNRDSRCASSGNCSSVKCSKTQCPAARCAATGCEKCCGSNQCANCCDKGKCSRGKCNMKPQVCPVKQRAGMSLNWKLELSSLQGVKANAVKPEKDIVLGFDFAKRRCYGVSGVNRYFGPITVNPKEGKLSFGQLGSTMMMGPGLDYEQAYLKMLATVDGCDLDNGQLILTSKGKVVARYVPIDKIQ